MFFEDCIFFDLETVPDMTRFTAPKPRTDSGLDLTEIASMKVNDLKERLSLLSMDELKMLHDLEEIDTNRSGVKTAIKSETKKLIEEQETIVKQWSVDPWRCQICAFSCYDTKAKKHGTITAVDQKTEILLLQQWYSTMKFRKRISWGGLRFDDQVIVARSLILGVRGFAIDIGPNWRNTQHMDLSQVFGDRPMKNIAEYLGLTPKGGQIDMDGSMVYQAFKMKRMKVIAEYCESDVSLLRQIAALAGDIIAF